MEDSNHGTPKISSLGRSQWPSTPVPRTESDPDDFWPAVHDTIFMDICTAASLGDCDGITQALERDEKINCFSKNNGWTPLMFAASRNQSFAALHLIIHGANVTLCNKQDGRSALIFAAAGGSFELVHLLAREMIRQKHYSLLLAAEMVCDSKTERYKELPWLQKDFNPVHQDINSVFKEQMIGVDTWDIFGWTPLMHAVCFGTSETVKFFLKLGANINNTDIHSRTPLILATEYGREDIVRILLNCGADVTCKTCTGQTAFEYAALTGNFSIAKMIQSSTGQWVPGRSC